MDTTKGTQWSGLQNVADVIIAPKAAFERLREHPTWGWALLVVAIFGCVGIFLEAPASRHMSVQIVQHLIATNPNVAGMSTAQKNEMLAKAARPSPFSQAFSYLNSIILPLIASLLNAAILLLASAIGQGKTDFRRLWSGSMNIAAPTIGLYSLVLGIIATVRGPGSFNAVSDLYGAIPNLQYVVPGSSGFFGSFLQQLNIFVLWGFGLNVVMMQALAGVRNVVAWIFPAIITLLGATVFGGIISIVARFTGQ